MSKKLTSGEGWKIIPAEPLVEEKEVISKEPEKQKAKISVEKRNKGKVVTLISGLVLTNEDLNSLTKLIKTACGTGGTIDKGVIEIQGDNREKVKNWLQANKWGLK